MKNMNIFFGIMALFIVSIVGIGSASGSPAGMETGTMDMMHDFESGQEFGQHISMHAKTMGFSGEHNPGVHHRGFSPFAR